MLTIGTELKNRYYIAKVLASGGFGDTYLAEDRDLPGHPICVVKQLRPKDNNPEVFRIAKGLFEREAEYLYRIGNAHSQIPNLFAHFTANGEFYLVQEYIEGHSLTEELPQGKRLSETETIRLLLDILEVVAFIHQHNVIHRDIKLSNLMRRKKDGKVVLIDFGAVKDVSVLQTNSQGLTNMTVAIGSPGYMPSEQAQGKPKLSSDVYAVGMIGIQALTGICPANLPEDPATGEVLWHDRVHISTGLMQVLDKMTHYHFAQRYRSAIEALEALQAHAQAHSALPTQLLLKEDSAPQESEPTQLLPASTQTAQTIRVSSAPDDLQPLPPRKLHPALIPLSIVAVIGALGGFIFFATRPQQVTTVTTVERATPSPTAEISPTPAPTPTRTFSKVQINQLVQYKHPSGIFRIQVPEGWKLKDEGDKGIINQFWLDPAQNSFLSVQIFEDTGALDRDVLKNFVQTAFSQLPNYSASEPVVEDDASIRITWGYDEEVQGLKGRIFGNSYMIKYPNRMVILSFAILQDQFPPLRTKFETMIKSFDLDVSVALPK